MKKIKLTDLIFYFLKLGLTGFGGSVALAQTMHKDLVGKKHWLSHDEFLRGLTLSGLTPGPLSAQLAMYSGYVTRGVLGSSVVGFFFILPSFLIVLAFSYLYFSIGRIPQIETALVGIGACVVGIIASAAIDLTSKTMKPKSLLWTIFVGMFLYTALAGRTSMIFFVLSGILTMAIYSNDKLKFTSKLPAIIFLGLPLSLLTNSTPLEQLFGFFLRAGAIAFGGGFAIIPFLHTGVVHEFQWLTNKQFLDAMAIAMVTPGPVAISATFIGYKVAGVLGALTSTTAIFLPVYFLVILLTPFFIKHSGNSHLIAFVEGVTAASMGAIAGSIIILGKESIVSPVTFIIAATSFILSKYFKIPGVAIVFLSGILSVFLIR